MDDITIIPSPKKILYIGYNYNSFYFTLGTDIGFQVYQTYPLTLKFNRILKGGIGLVQILEKSNIFCLVGGGKSPKYAPNRLIIWDDKKRKEVYEFRFNSFVLNCFLKNKYIFIICSDTINIISIETLKILERISTFENPSGVCAISSAIDKYILTWPDLAKGKIAIKDFSQLKNSSIAISTQNSINNSIFGKKLSLKAHESNITKLSLNKDGTMLATASDRGAVIRVFNTETGKIIQELRRGNGDAKIYSINFSYDNKYVGLTSDRGTVHIFVTNTSNLNENNLNSSINNNNKNDENVKENDDTNENNVIKNNTINIGDFTMIDEDFVEQSTIIEKQNMRNNTSILSSVTKIIGFNNMFQSEWSFAQFKVPYREISYLSFLGNEKDNDKIVVIDKNGNYTVAELNNEKIAKIIKKDCLL